VDRLAGPLQVPSEVLEDHTDLKDKAVGIVESGMADYNDTVDPDVRHNSSEVVELVQVVDFSAEVAAHLMVG